MSPEGVGRPGRGVETVLSGLAGTGLLTRLTWADWLTIAPPYRSTGIRRREVTARYRRNGYDWDICATLYCPAREVDPDLAFVFFHGGSGSARGKDETPDGRPGIATVLATQGFTVLSLTYPGHYPPGGIWTVPIAERQPVYLLDQNLSAEEVRDRNLKCTFNVILQGAGLLVDAHLAGRRLLAFGHSTGGPMAAHLTRFTAAAQVVGIVGFGSGGPDGWRGQWREATGAESHKEQPLDFVARQTAEGFRRAGYQDPPELCPWGGAEAYVAWGARVRSQIKTGLRFNQHRAALPALERYPALTELPAEEYLDHLQDPDPAWLASIAVLLLVGEADRGHWLCGETIEQKLEMYMTARYAEQARRARLVVVPRLGHYGFASLHNEKIAYLWLWALCKGFFSTPTAQIDSPRP
jgi:hypothetical protein